MSNVSEAFESLQSHLAQGQERATRLSRLLGSLWDEVGHPTILALPEARALLSRSFEQIGDAAATLGIELDDTRWVAVVTLTHAAGERVKDHVGNGGVTVPGMTADEAGQASALLAGLQYRVMQLRNRRQGIGEMVVRLS